MSTGHLEFSDHAVTGRPKIQSRHNLGGQAKGEFGDSSPQSFLPPNVVVLRKICFKTKIFPPEKYISIHPNLKTGYRPGPDKIVSAINVQHMFEGHTALRCSITSKNYFINQHYGGPYKHFWGS